MQILRHSQIAITMQVYSEVPSKATQDALRRLGRSLGGPAATAAPCCCTKTKEGPPARCERPVTWWAILGSNQ